VTRPLLTNIQILRFLAAVAVLVGHAGDLFIPDNGVWRQIPWSGGVDVFFVISGFVMVYLTQGQFGSHGAPKIFLVRRIVRIAPPYWIFTTLMVVTILVLGEHVRHTQLTAPTVTASYLFLPWPRADGEINPLLSQGWTLNYEAFFYLTFAMCLWFRHGLWILGAAFLTLVGIHALVPSPLFMLRFWTNPIILEFLAGVGLGLAFLSGRRIPPAMTVALVVGAVTLFILTEPLAPSPYRRIIHVGLPALLFCAALALAPEPARSGPVRRLLVLGGDSSYTLYLSHTFTLNAAMIAWRQSGGNVPVGLGIAISCVLAVAAAVIFYRLVERPMTDAIHRAIGTPAGRGIAAVAP